MALACLVAAGSFFATAFLAGAFFAAALAGAFSAGAFLAVDWALMTDIIPKATAGRYMGILNAGTAMAGPVYRASLFGDSEQRLPDAEGWGLVFAGSLTAVIPTVLLFAMPQPAWDAARKATQPARPTKR